MEEEKKETPQEQDIEIDLNKGKKKKKRLLLIFPILLIVLGVFASIGSAPETYGYSQDHKKVFGVFGNPDSFTIIWDPETSTRIETWNYLELGETFTFKNGQFAYRTHNEFDKNDNEEGFSLILEPKDFYNISTISEINLLLEAEPSSEGEIHEDLLGSETSFYSYDNWLHVGELSGNIVYIAKNTQYINSSYLETGPSDVTGDLSEFVFTNSDYGFSFKMGTYSERLFEKALDYGQDYDSYVYCYISSNAYENEYCGSDAYPIFSIDVMDENQYQTNIVDDPYGDMYEELGTANGYYYLFSRPNGDIPEDAPSYEFHNSVKETFESEGSN